MKLTRTADETIRAYNQGYRIISNRGGTRSGKSYAILQILYLLAKYQKRSRVITCISHSFPHLEMGIVRDFNSILEDDNIPPESVSTKRPYIYKIGRSLIEFVSVDNIGKSLGAARDILFVNEANRIKHNIFHQLAVRTAETIFIDFNPDGEFWLTKQGYSKQDDFIEITSTYKDNIRNLSIAQIQDLITAEQKAQAERKAGKSGYWSYWWQVYGEGRYGRIVDRLVIPNYEKVTTIPERFKLKCYGLDFGFSTDPTAMVAIYTDGDDILCDEVIYQTGLVNVPNAQMPGQSIYEQITAKNIDTSKFIIAESAEPKSIVELRTAGVKIYAVKKQTIQKSIRQLLQYNFYVTERSRNLIAELDGYMYPIDKDDNVLADNPIGADHLIDAIRYAILMKNRLWK